MVGNYEIHKTMMHQKMRFRCHDVEHCGRNKTTLFFHSAFNHVGLVFELDRLYVVSMYLLYRHHSHRKSRLHTNVYHFFVPITHFIP